ncbi:IS1380 family transposase [Nocardia terpenica]|uniref:Transposase n=1 Tax=Nocardia terpenica TaxID=455432 RepID=A0A164MJ16_9NOCA|nr:IS1380 family transposase [Nocardia terpenica]KZM73401.1 transposase [Nocardia terpenica]NQE87429.1 IS1380 family transposase [Nocardia terpenica]
MSAGSVSARFDEPNLIGFAGLVPVVRLAERCGLPELSAELLRWKSSPNSAGASPVVKMLTLVFGMVAGADTIDGMGRLRHGAMGRAFAGVRAPSTLGSFLRAFTHGHVQQLAAVCRKALPALASHAPLLPGADAIAYVDIDDTIRRTYGYAKQGAGIGYSKIKGLNALIACVSTPIARPVIVAARLRRGAVNSARGAASFVAEAVKAARAAGATGLLVVRADSAFYAEHVVAAAHGLGAHFSVTVRMNASIRAAISSISENDWIPIKYPQAVWDADGQCWISDAEIGRVRYTAFTSKPKRCHVTAWLIVRRVPRLGSGHTQGQGELFATHRFHAVFTDSPLPLVDAEKSHRHHAIVEQVIADLKGSALAHCPSGVFAANAAWLQLACLAYNLTRAAGAIASVFHAKATTATIRADLIAVPARLASSGRQQIWHLPTDRPAGHAWQQLFDTVHAPPAAA